MSVVVVMAGNGGAGKTTTTRTFAIGEPEEVITKEKIVLARNGETVERKCVYTLYENCAVAGNHNSGTDANNSPQLVRIALERCLDNRDVAIIDGYMSTSQWVHSINNCVGVERVIIVQFDLTMPELLRRVAGRLGIAVEDLPEKRIERAKSNITRPLVLIRHFTELSKVPFEVIEVWDEDSPDDIVAEIDMAICDVFQDCEE